MQKPKILSAYSAKVTNMLSLSCAVKGPRKRVPCVRYFLFKPKKKALSMSRIVSSAYHFIII